MFVLLNRYYLQNSKGMDMWFLNKGWDDKSFLLYRPFAKKKKKCGRFGTCSFSLQRHTAWALLLSPQVQAKAWASLVHRFEAHLLLVTLTLWHWKESGLGGVLMGRGLRINVHSRLSKVEFLTSWRPFSGVLRHPFHITQGLLWYIQHNRFLPGSLCFSH